LKQILSIITPVYNGEKFIQACIENVIEQECPEVEHIILDGCSTDKTVAIVRNYAEKFPHIKWLSEKDKGQSDAMNKGIEMANGKVIGFLNVDDYYEPNVLNRVRDFFETLPEPSLLVGNCNVWDDHGNLLYINKPSRLKLHQLLLGYYINPWPVNPSAYFYHRCIHEKIGLYKIGEHYALDIDFILRAVQVAHVRYVDEIWGNYNLLEGTKTVSDLKNGTSSKRIRAILKAYRKDLPWFFNRAFIIYAIFARDLPLFIKWIRVVSRKYLFKIHK
jgi:glycosyltransferase involved in cell wall biosynthesis